MINSLPTVFEVVTGGTKKHSKERTTPNSSIKSNKSSSKLRQSEVKASRMAPPRQEEGSGEDDEEDDDEHGNTLCGACGENYADDEFWICCDLCERWFHGKCVKITPARAEHIKQYKCPACSNKRSRV